MSASDMRRGIFQPTASEARKYASYSVVRREAVQPVRISSAGSQPLRLIVRFARVPSEQAFYWRPRIGITPAEEGLAERWAERLRLGWWAEFPQNWFRHRMTDGRWFYVQHGGLLIREDPLDFHQWESELEPQQLER